MKTLVTIFLSFIFFGIQAQNNEHSNKFIDQIRGNSIGVMYTSNSFNVAFKKNKANNKSLLISGTGIEFRFSEPNYSFTAGVNLHYLTNRYFNDRFYISHGAGFGVNTATNINQTFSLQAVNAELSYRVEFNYEVGNNFALGIALNPGIQLTSTVNRAW